MHVQYVQYTYINVCGTLRIADMMTDNRKHDDVEAHCYIVGYRSIDLQHTLYVEQSATT